MLCGYWGTCLSLWVTLWASECLSECRGATWVLRHCADMWVTSGHREARVDVRVLSRLGVLFIPPGPCGLIKG